MRKLLVLPLTPELQPLRHTISLWRGRHRVNGTGGLTWAAIFAAYGSAMYATCTLCQIHIRSSFPLPSSSGVCCRCPMCRYQPWLSLLHGPYLTAYQTPKWVLRVSLVSVNGERRPHLRAMLRDAYSTLAWYHQPSLAWTTKATAWCYSYRRCPMETNVYPGFSLRPLAARDTIFGRCHRPFMPLA